MNDEHDPNVDLDRVLILSRVCLVIGVLALAYLALPFIVRGCP